MGFEADAGKWLMGLVQAGVIGTLLTLGKLVFDRVIIQGIKAVGDRQEAFSEEVIKRMEAIGQSVQDHNQRLALGNQAFANLRDKVGECERELRETREIVRRQEISIIHLTESVRELQEGQR